MCRAADDPRSQGSRRQQRVRLRPPAMSATRRFSGQKRTFSAHWPMTHFDPSEILPVHRANCFSPDQNESSANELRTFAFRSEEHTSELQSHLNLVCRLLLEKK